MVRFYEGVDGLKTGHTEEAGYCLTATAKKNNMRIIAVVMGEPDSKMRNQEVSQMLDYTFAQYKTEDLLKGKRTIGSYEVSKGKEKYVNIVPKDKANIVLKKADKVQNSNYDVKVYNLKAPVKKGDVVGKVKISQKGKTVKIVDLTVQRDVKKANIWTLYLRNLLDIFKSDITI